MTVNDWLKQATEQLKSAGIETARLDAIVLLNDVLNTNSAQLLAEPEYSLSNEQINRLEPLLQRRIKHEPLAYIRSSSEFYGRDFFVDAKVLVPRPETETMIDLAKNLPVDAKKCFVDVGTGSGAIAITMACELGEVQVLATDIDQNCLKIARKNAVKHHATVDLHQANLIERLHFPVDATILANLPYVPNDYKINQAAKTEPRLAIFGGDDGLDLFRQLFQQLQAAQHQGYVLTEALPFQHKELSNLAQQFGYELNKTDDFIQVFIKDSAVKHPA